MSLFQLHTPFPPAGHQPQAIDALVNGVNTGANHQTLLGVTGSGKTFVLANAIAQLDRPVLVLSHNKTLCAQLYGEFKAFFPENAVEYFISYYDYYQPEAYLPSTDVYIEKDASINEDIDRLRLSATTSLMLRRDVIVVASVSCIYGLGRPEDYDKMRVPLAVGLEINREEILRRLVKIQYTRNDIGFSRGNIRVMGDTLEVAPTYQESVIRIELFGDEVESIREVHPVSGEILRDYDQLSILPAKHFVMEDGSVDNALDSIQAELEEQLRFMRRHDKLLEAQRLESRTKYDLEMLAEIGYCQGVENYSRHFDGRAPGERPACLLDYFPEDYLLVIDESHVTVPQVRGMFNGDRARKLNLVEHGFRLPSALDNRPLKPDEFEALQPQTVYVSATPGEEELNRCDNLPIELIVRPTGLIDPPIEIRPTEGQVQDIMKEIEARAGREERVLITTVTKRLSEDLDAYCRERHLRTMYLHSDIQALERVEILKNLRLGRFDALIGVNLLREGLDLPEVSLVIILDADKQGFLRSRTSLLQLIGRTARHVAGEVILYADSITEAMQATIDETERRRAVQVAYNEENNITPRSVKRAIDTGLEEYLGAAEEKGEYGAGNGPDLQLDEERAAEISLLEEEMVKASEEMRFEDAARLRDRLLQLGAALEFTPQDDDLPGRRRGKGKGRKRRSR
ncbi:MAG: excinuclease ABC subunit UvrB [Planctomycetota bacterium]